MLELALLMIVLTIYPNMVYLGVEVSSIVTSETYSGHGYMPVIYALGDGFDHISIYGISWD